MTRSCNNIGAYDNTTTKNVSYKGGVISEDAFYFGPNLQKNTNKSLSLYVFTFGGKNMRDNGQSISKCTVGCLQISIKTSEFFKDFFDLSPF